MKKLYIFAALGLLFNSVLVNAQTERGNRNKEFNNRNENREIKQPTNREPQIRQPREPQIKHEQTPRENRNNTPNRNVERRTEPAVRTEHHNRVTNNNNTNRDIVASRNVQIQRTDNASRNGYNRYNRIDRNYYPDYRRPYSFVGQRYSNFYGRRYAAPYRGINYYYSGGFFYQPYNNYFQVIVAPVGIRIYGLPWGYRKWYIGPSLYYYYGGTYYRNVNNYYEVVDAPLGSILPELPTGTKLVVINGQQYFEQNGTYYKESLRNGETWYTIVGKNGSLTTTTDTINEVDVLVGDMVTDLPDNCTTVVLNNQKYYVSDKQVYYQELISDNNLYYKIVAKPQ